MELHSRNPRTVFVVTKADVGNELVVPCRRGKAHVLVALMQDYRLGGRKYNSLLIPIGFCLYKVSIAECGHTWSIWRFLVPSWTFPWAKFGNVN